MRNPFRKRPRRHPTLDKIVDALKWMRDNVGAILGTVGKVLGKIPGVGDAFDPKMTLPTVGAVAAVTGGDSTINQALWDELGMARSMGLSLTSGYRPGAITRSGTPSDHGTFPSKAIDVAGSASAMAAFFRAKLGDRSIKQMFYDPLGSSFGGVWSSYREGGHTDHVHASVFDKGGWLAPFSKTLAINRTPQWEPVGPPGRVGAVEQHFHFPNYVGSRTELFQAMSDAAQIFLRRNGRPAFGGFA